jgi:SAM-dependent methyltransferase
MAVINGKADDLLTPLLVCPACKSDIERQMDGYTCTGCDAHYSVVDNTPVFAEAQTGYENEEAGIAFRKRYEWQYHDEQDAREYDDSFKKSSRKRQRTRRELDIVTGFLERKGKSRTLLDIPCGGGRLSGPMSAATDYLIEADISPAQLQLALAQDADNQTGMIISALALPFASGSIDGVVCARLSHHLPDPSEQEKLLVELLRVSNGFVVFSFTDRNSVQSFGRKIRGKALNPCSMTIEEIETLSAANGGRVEQIQTVSNIGPRHRFALITKIR